MNIYDYIDEYGIYSFSEKEFNEVDSAIFSFLSYADFSNIFEGEKMTIQEIGRKHIGLHSKKENNVIAVREGNRILKYLKDTKRYRNCLIYNHKYEGTEDIQFGVIAIEYQKNEIYVSFEGTDELISGWKENLFLSYKFPTKTHLKAISYLNRNYTFSNKKIIVGGHSKGGNLAIVAGAYANFFVRKKIKKVYNFDGPGLLEKEYYGKAFQKILPKYIHIIPDYSIVGLLLENTNTKVVKSNNKTILSHNIFYWEIDNDHFVKSNLSLFSKNLNNEIDNWCSKYSSDEKYDFINNLENICKKVDVSSLLDFKERKTKLIDLIHESKDLTENSKKILMDFVALFLKCLNNTTISEIKNLINRKIKLPKMRTKEDSNGIK
ncbi:MAG: DUF2974 domain-containing protein [Bacilli bacterium]|nr:DUF2974 domain-containing protein [Bacilli bacterium]